MNMSDKILEEDLLKAKNYQINVAGIFIKVK